MTAHTLAELDVPKRGQVRISGRNPVDVADDVAAEIIDRNNPPRLFRMGDSAVELRDDGLLKPLDADGWLYYVARRIDFMAASKDGGERIAPALPMQAMKLVPAAVMDQLPVLNGVVSTPFLDAAGNVVDQDGYHEGTRLVLHAGKLELPPVASDPSPEDMAAATKLLTDDWLGDFPFDGEADRANAIGLLLTLTGRAFFGLAPLFVIDASTPGSGKGLLVHTVNLIATGEAPHLLQLPADGEEQRKKITTALLAGTDPIVWDESHVISGRALAMILTAEQYSDRLLGGNKMITVENRFTQVALGNNVQVWGDMKRRVVPARLVPDCEHPERRSGFRHEDLPAWVLANRGRLLAAAFTIWRAWIAAGRPRAHTGMGSFEGWARAVGGALQNAGIRGFMSNLSEWVADSDLDDPEWGEHLAEIHRVYSGAPFTTLDVALRIGRGEITQPPFQPDPGKPFAKQLGYQYRAKKDRWMDGYRLVKAGEAHASKTKWTVQIQRHSDAGPAEIMSSITSITSRNRDKSGSREDMEDMEVMSSAHSHNVNGATRSRPEAAPPYPSAPTGTSSTAGSTATVPASVTNQVGSWDFDVSAPGVQGPPACPRCGDRHERYGPNGRPCKVAVNGVAR
jgi:hypothetical protein